MNTTAQSFYKLDSQFGKLNTDLESDKLLSHSLHDEINETEMFTTDEHVLCVLPPSST